MYHFLFILFPEQMCLSDRELNEAYQDVQEMFSPGSYNVIFCFCKKL